MRPIVIVVEGSHDVDKIRKIFKDVPIIDVGGSAIIEKQLELIKKFDQTHDIVLALDPDHAGERIRKIISRNVENVLHVFVDREKAMSKSGKKIGLEHMSESDLYDAFKHIKTVQSKITSDIDASFLHDMQLIGHRNSKQYRNQLSHQLSLGIVNGKTLIKRLQMFGYMKKDIIEVMHESSS